MILLFAGADAATFYSRQTGNWSQTTSWSTASCGGGAAASVPTTNDIVFICNTHVKSVTANANVTSVTVQNGGTLTTGTSGGGANKTLTISGNFILLNGGTYIHNNNQVAATTVFAGVETFEANSTFRVSKWSGTAASMITGCNSNFGNLILNWNPGLFYWNNNGLGYTRSILGNFTVNNACATYLDDTNGNKTFSFGGNVIVDNGYLRFKQSGTGNIVINLSGALQILNSSFVYGIYQQNGNLNFNLGSVDLAVGTFYGIYNGDGLPTFNITGTYKQSAGDFRGIQNNTTYSAGVPNFQIGSVNFTGGVFIANYSCNTVSSTVSYVVAGNMNISFSNTTDLFAIHRLATLSTTAATAKLFMQVGGDFTISGVLGEFNSNNATGSEVVNLLGSFNVSGGNNYFNVIPNYGGNGHALTLTINGSVAINGGNTYLSSESGLLTANLQGNLTVGGGALSMKGGPGIANINLVNNYLQSAGNLNIYNNTINSSLDAITWTVNGNFTQSGGTISFSTNAASTAINTLYLKGGSYTLGTGGSMTRAGAGTASVFGILNFNRAGTISMTRSGSHDIQQVKQNILSGCLLDVVAGNLQVASHATAATDFLVVQPLATLNLNANQIYSDATAANSGISVLNTGRLRTSHASGFFNNTAVASLSNVGAMNFYLDQNSIVEYYGTGNQVLTGINVGIATSNNHKYGILEINNTGSGTFLTPTNIPAAINAVYIRQELRLTNGIINLAGAAGNPANGGRTIYIERADPSAITRTNGFLRSEAQDHSGALNWNLANVTGTYIIPFAYAAAQYIPLIYTLSSGNVGTINFATYHTGSSNIPWPPSIANLNSEIGLLPDNRDATVDRFWNITPSSTGLATIEFNYLPSEIPPSPYDDASLMRAQNYHFGTNKWQAALPTQSATANKVNVSGVVTQSDWALANNISPLPVSWLYFNASSVGMNVRLNWATASEVNNDYFLVERSKDMIHSEILGKVKGVGNSSEVSSYEFFDNLPLPNNSYYRLRQVDYDGKEELTKWVAIYLKSGDGRNISIGPNPTNDFINVSGIQGSFKLMMFDSVGKLIVESQVSNPTEKINIAHLPKGIYSAQFISEEIGVITTKIVKH
ncbi:MAG: hypothetical protein IPO63_18010 [Bacteroidetes bacterium]|nr:hypothetical protein [Bacteroidota bacterium]